MFHYNVDNTVVPLYCHVCCVEAVKVWLNCLHSLQAITIVVTVAFVQVRGTL